VWDATRAGATSGARIARSRCATTQTFTADATRHRGSERSPTPTKSCRIPPNARATTPGSPPPRRPTRDRRRDFGRRAPQPRRAALPRRGAVVRCGRGQDDSTCGPEHFGQRHAERPERCGSARGTQVRCGASRAICDVVGWALSVRRTIPRDGGLVVASMMVATGRPNVRSRPPRRSRRRAACQARGSRAGGRARR
jgi:hypothetical protein